MAAAPQRVLDTSSPLKIPERRTADAPPAPPPTLPAQADSLPPTTLTLAMRRSNGRAHVTTARQTVSRTADRMHLRGDDGREWLFERNPIDHRRASATLVDHKSKSIVLYEDTDLRMALGLRGWGDVVTLGFDSARVACPPGAPGRAIGPVSFLRCRVATASGSSSHVWWSQTSLLAAQFTLMGDDGVSSLSIERVQSGVHAESLDPPVLRFPTYTVIDFADSLEKH